MLANVYLNQLDIELVRSGYKIIRYADDFVVMCRDRNESEAGLELIQGWVYKSGLQLSPEKTHIGDSLIKGHGFEFLGVIGCEPHEDKNTNIADDKTHSRTSDE